MSVLKKFFQMALLLTFIIFTINLTILFFSNTYIPDSGIPILANLSDNNIYVEADINGSYILQTATLGTAPTEFENIQYALSTSIFGFQDKLEVILAVHELAIIGKLIGYILDAIIVLAIIYLGAAAIGTPIGGSVP